MGKFPRLCAIVKPYAARVLEIHFLNMVKWRKLDRKDIANEPLHRWLTWFDENSPPELIAEVMKMDNAIRMAEEKQTHVLSDEDAIRAYEYRQKLQWDEISFRNDAIREGKAEGLAEGKAEGLAEGIAKGIVQTNLEIARKMKALGDSTERINSITGLSPETIENL